MVKRDQVQWSQVMDATAWPTPMPSISIKEFNRIRGVRKAPITDLFGWHWRALVSTVPLAAEYRFAPPRKWRFDFAHELSRVAIECDGATFVGGRHTRGAGYERDCEKLNRAAADGWAVFRLTRQMLEKDPVYWCTLIAETIHERLPAKRSVV